MKMMRVYVVIGIITTATVLSGCQRRYPRVEDVTPGNPAATEFGPGYGANEIRVQTDKINKQLMNRWLAKTGYDLQQGQPRIIITQIENLTDQYIPTEMIREIIEGVAINDGRYTVVVGDAKDEKELDALMEKIRNNPKYSNSSRLKPHQATAPQFLAQVKLLKSVSHLPKYDIEDWRMSVTLYDIETGEAIDQAYDVLRKKVYRR
ncbi:hypothetical protein JYU14_02655 [Simkania negevensis]|uniref:Lipoprotein n=1 Tax=Simkania negevensis TaxID=83561 RepID=A0ABS3AR16_9BACT|nr:hypothetical protein [Simkania negevensis]